MLLHTTYIYHYCSSQLAGCGPLRGSINPLAVQPVDCPRSARLIVPQKDSALLPGPYGERLDFNLNSYYFASPHLDFPIKMIFNPFKFKLKLVCLFIP